MVTFQGNCKCIFFSFHRQSQSITYLGFSFVPFSSLKVNQHQPASVLYWLEKILSIIVLRVIVMTHFCHVCRSLTKSGGISDAAPCTATRRYIITVRQENYKDEALLYRLNSLSAQSMWNGFHLLKLYCINHSCKFHSLSIIYSQYLTLPRPTPIKLPISSDHVLWARRRWPWMVGKCR